MHLFFDQTSKLFVKYYSQFLVSTLTHCTLHFLCSLQNHPPLVQLCKFSVMCAKTSSSFSSVCLRATLQITWMHAFMSRAATLVRSGLLTKATIQRLLSSYTILQGIKIVNFEHVLGISIRFRLALFCKLQKSSEKESFYNKFSIKSKVQKVFQLGAVCF